MKSGIIPFIVFTCLFVAPVTPLWAQNQVEPAENPATPERVGPPPPPQRMERPSPPARMERPASQEAMRGPVRPAPRERMRGSLQPEVRRSNARVSMPMIPGLTDEQRSAIRELVLQGREEAVDIENQLRELRARLRTVTSGETVDMNEASDVIDEITTLQAEEMKVRVNQRNEIRNLLTDEQKIFFDSRRGSDNRAGLQRGRQRDSQLRNRPLPPTPVPETEE